MTTYCPDYLLRRVHYFVRQWFFSVELCELVDFIDLLSCDFDDLPVHIKEILELFIEEVIDGIDPLLENTIIKSERYNSLSPMIKEMFESSPNSIIQVNNVIDEAFRSRDEYTVLKKELREVVLSNKKCMNCEVFNKIKSKKGILYS